MVRITTAAHVPPGVAAAQPQHLGLHRACAHLSRLLSPPPEAVPPAPVGALTLALEDVTREWSAHVSITEAPDGILAQVVTDCPRLAPMAQRLQREHPVVTSRLGIARGRLGSVDAELTAVMTELAALLDAVERHRHAGGELLHLAYNVDLGLGD